MTSWPKNTDPARRNLLKGLAAAPLLSLAEA